MKTNSKKLFLLGSVVLTTLIATAQNDKEAIIRHLEEKERIAVLNTDSLTLFNNLWSSDMVVNTPANRVGTVEGTKIQLRTGKLHYQSFERNIEKITFNDNLAIVMGEEKLKPQGQQDNAGKQITRRFTNIWKYKKKKWQIIARQATIIKME
jgi:hypothetical protein